MVFQLHWSSWTYQQHSIRLTMRLCFSVCELLSASTAEFTDGYAVVNAWSNTVCTARATQIINSPSDLWSASRVNVGSLLFILYTADLMSLIEDNGFSPNLYADDTQVYGSCRPVEIDAYSQRSSLSASFRLQLDAV